MECPLLLSVELVVASSVASLPILSDFWWCVFPTTVLAAVIAVVLLVLVLAGLEVTLLVAAVLAAKGIDPLDFEEASSGSFACFPSFNEFENLSGVLMPGSYSVYE